MPMPGVHKSMELTVHRVTPLTFRKRRATMPRSSWTYRCTKPLRGSFTWAGVPGVGNLGLCRLSSCCDGSRGYSRPASPTGLDSVPSGRSSRLSEALCCRLGSGVRRLRYTLCVMPAVTGIGMILRRPSRGSASYFLRLETAYWRLCRLKLGLNAPDMLQRRGISC